VITVYIPVLLHPHSETMMSIIGIGCLPNQRWTNCSKRSWKSAASQDAQTKPGRVWEAQGKDWGERQV